MTNRQRFFLNGFLLSLVGIAVRGVSIVYNSYIAKNIGAEGIGLFTLIGTVYSFGVTFATAGVSLTITRLTASAIGEEDFGKVRSVLRGGVKYALIFSSVASIALFLLSPYLSLRVIGDRRALLPLRILSFSLLPISLSTVLTGYFIGVRRVGYNAAVSFFGQIARLFISVTLLLKYSARGAAAGITALSVSMTLTEILIFTIALLGFLYDKYKHLSGCNKKGSSFFDVCSMALPISVSANFRQALLTVEHILIPKGLRTHGESSSESLSSYGMLHGMALPMLIYPMAPLSSFAGLLIPEFSESEARGDVFRCQRLAAEALSATLKYSLFAATLIFVFSEELGYVFYSSYGAGHYIALMAPVIPIMYLDHVTDSILKGIGEHVYSMWVNISDSALSVVLVFFLIPAFGIGAYAFIIVIMEGYNFLLSFFRLRRKIRFKINFSDSIILPAIASFLSAFISREIFGVWGKSSTPVLLLLKILFSICAGIFFYLTMKEIGYFLTKSKEKRRNN